MSNTSSLTLSDIWPVGTGKIPASPSGTAWPHTRRCTAGVMNLPPEMTLDLSAGALLTGCGGLATFLRPSGFLRHG
jgi:hypothetical protein